MVVIPPRVEAERPEVGVEQVTAMDLTIGDLRAVVIGTSDAGTAADAAARQAWADERTECGVCEALS